MTIRIEVGGARIDEGGLLLMSEVTLQHSLLSGQLPLMRTSMHLRQRLFQKKRAFEKRVCEKKIRLNRGDG